MMFVKFITINLNKSNKGYNNNFYCNLASTNWLANILRIFLLHRIQDICLLNIFLLTTKQHRKWKKHRQLSLNNIFNSILVGFCCPWKSLASVHRRFHAVHFTTSTYTHLILNKIMKQSNLNETKQQNRTWTKPIKIYRRRPEHNWAATARQIY